MAETYKKKAGQTGDDAPEDWKDIIIEVTDVLQHSSYRQFKNQLDGLIQEIALLETKKDKAELRLASVKTKFEIVDNG